jgi:hypothetical protein
MDQSAGRHLRKIRRGRSRCEPVAHSWGKIQAVEETNLWARFLRINRRESQSGFHRNIQSSSHYPRCSRKESVEDQTVGRSVRSRDQPELSNIALREKMESR